jgi:hypothetical protein
MDTENDSLPGGKRGVHRSPNYPVIDLANAIARVEKLYRADGKGGAPLDAALPHIGYNTKNGSALKVVSALKKYGLVEDRSDRLVPTKLFVEIASFKNSENVSRYQSALRQAALGPDVISEVLARYKEAGQIPSDRTLAAELTADFNFAPPAAELFLNVFKSTLTFAGLLEDKKIVLEEEPRDHGESGPTGSADDSSTNFKPPDQEVPVLVGRVARSESAIAKQIEIHMHDYAIPLTRGKRDLLRLPSPLSEADFATLAATIQLWKGMLVEESGVVELGSEACKIEENQIDE